MHSRLRACILWHSAACCTTDPTKVTGAVAPAGGMLTISAGTPARARSTRFCEANTDQFSGGDGQTSKIARGLFRGASRPPLSMAQQCKRRLLEAERNTGAVPQRTALPTFCNRSRTGARLDIWNSGSCTGKSRRVTGGIPACRDFCRPGTGDVEFCGGRSGPSGIRGAPGDSRLNVD